MRRNIIAQCTQPQGTRSGALDMSISSGQIVHRLTFALLGGWCATFLYSCGLDLPVAIPATSDPPV